MDMQAKHQLTISVLPRYLRANKEGKKRILDEYCANTGYHRKHAIRKLKEYQFTHGIRWKKPGKHRRRRGKVYDMRVQAALATLWNVYDRICAERIHPNMGEMVRKLSACSILKLDPDTEAKVTHISLGTLKRLLRDIREREYKKIHGTTKPGTLLKNQIPLRIGQWEEKKPGFEEMDLVAHCGDRAGGDFAHTLNTTDIHTQWFEAEAVLGKAQERVFKAVQHIRGRLPFELLGIDSDNDGSFINHQMHRYCLEEKIMFTRSRPYKKNDNAHIEQKNWMCVRKLLGYMRIDAVEQVVKMNELFRGPLRYYINFFLPSMKCIEKKRIGSKIVKTYDQARTPYQRVIESQGISEKTKDRLSTLYNQLNPVELKREIDRLIQETFGKKSEKREKSARVTYGNILK
jgi:hypothetical protein